MKKIIALASLIFGATSLAAGSDWRMELHKWVLESESNSKCKVWYTVGIHRPDMGAQPEWGLMSEQMFRWLSKNGEKIAPNACFVNFTDLGKAKYRILLSETPMMTETRTVHGAETRTQTTPTNATFSANNTYSDGGYSTTTGTISGTQTSTVVVPTETTYSRSTSSVYMYTYRMDGLGMHLIASDSVNYTRVSAMGTGDNAAGAEIGAGLRNAISASRDKHRADKLYKAAMETIAIEQP